jgi:hypothetical protein
MIRLRPTNRTSNLKVQPYYNTESNNKPEEKKFVSPLERNKRFEQINRGPKVIFYQ